MFRFRTLAAIALVALIAAPAFAADLKNFRVINNSGATASDLHLTIGNTGGALTPGNITVLVNAAVCGAPTITISGGGGNVVNLDWGANNCAAPGDLVIVRVNAPAAAPGSLAISSGEWTFSNQGPVAINVGNDTASIQVPTVSQWGLIVMTLALLVAATIIFARRRPAAAHA